MHSIIDGVKQHGKTVLRITEGQFFI